MSIGVAVPMPVIMIFPGPGAFPIMPPAIFMHVMRTGPICAGVGRPRIVTGSPAIVLALGRPETTYPDQGRFRRRWRHLDADGRRCYPYVDGDLRPGWRRESCCNNSESHTLFEHAAPFPENSKILHESCNQPSLLSACIKTATPPSGR
jgi:hypothetical protein